MVPALVVDVLVCTVLCLVLVLVCAVFVCTVLFSAAVLVLVNEVLVVIVLCKVLSLRSWRRVLQEAISRAASSPPCGLGLVAVKWSSQSSPVVGLCSLMLILSWFLRSGSSVQAAMMIRTV